MTRTIRQILSAGVLLAYSLGGTSLGSGLFTLLATWSGSHQVTVRAQETGEVEVVLHHQQGNFTPYASDHRDVLAQVLASISGSNDLGDHVLTQHLAKAASFSQRGLDEVLRASGQQLPLLVLTLIPSEVFPWCVPMWTKRDANLRAQKFCPAHDSGTSHGWPHASERVVALLI